MKRSRSPKLGESGRITGTEDRSEHGPRTSFERLNALGEAIGAPYHANKHFALPPPDKRGAQTLSGHRRGSRPPPAPLLGIQGTAGPPRWPSPPAPAGPLASNPSAPPARPRLYPAVVPSGAEPVGKTFQVRMHRRFNCEGCHGIRSRPNRCWLSNPGRSNPKPLTRGKNQPPVPNQCQPALNSL